MPEQGSSKKKGGGMTISNTGVFRNAGLLSLALGTLTASSLIRTQDPVIASHSHPVRNTSVAPDAASIGRWLWPGAFEVPIGPASTQVAFSGSGRRYVAEVRSDGFTIGRGADLGGAAEVRFLGART